MSDASRRLLTVLAAVALVLSVLGVSMQLLLAPAYTRYLAAAVDAPRHAGLPSADALALAEKVRAYVAGVRGAELPGRLDDGREAFDAYAVAHLDDVREVIAGARVATAVAVVFSAVWLFWGLKGAEERRAAIGRSLRGAAWTLLALPGVVVLAALIDFGWAFAAFHALFFEGDSWLFPSDALLIRLFPESFWAISGGVWCASMVTCAVLLGIWGKRVAPGHSAR